MNPEKVMRLIALAGNNPNENEARTAAFLACKAIREGGLLLVAKDDPRLRGSRGAPPPPPRPQPPPPPPSYAEAKRQAQSPPRKLITLQFPGWCKVCRKDIPADSKAWWLKGDGCVCVGCHT